MRDKQYVLLDVTQYKYHYITVEVSFLSAFLVRGFKENWPSNGSPMSLDLPPILLSQSTLWTRQHLPYSTIYSSQRVNSKITFPLL